MNNNHRIEIKTKQALTSSNANYSKIFLKKKNLKTALGNGVSHYNHIILFRK